VEGCVDAGRLADLIGASRPRAALGLPPAPAPRARAAALALLHRWLDTWTGPGLVIVGVPGSPVSKGEPGQYQS
jgi:hypothetical protein